MNTNTITQKHKRSIIRQALKRQKNTYGKTYVSDLRRLTMSEMKDYLK